VVGAEHAAAAGQGVLVQFAGRLILAEAGQVGAIKPLTGQRRPGAAY